MAERPDTIGDAERRRLLDVARAEFVRHGIRRTGIGDIADSAAVSRRTVHRRCGDKDDIVAAVVAGDVEAFIRNEAATIASFDSPATRAVEAFVAGIREARTNLLVRAIREFDPDMFNDIMVRRPQSMTLVTSGIAAMIADDTLPLDAARPVTEVMLRITTSLVVAPTEVLPVDTDERARVFALKYFVPSIEAARAECAAHARS